MANSQRRVAAVLCAVLVVAVLGWWTRGRATPVPAHLPYAGVLAGRTIIIDPGHGGWDPGATSKTAQEADINVDIAEALRAWLSGTGARVLMTWSRQHPIPRDRKFRVVERSRWINAQHADVLVDIHTNAGVGGVGPQVFYWDGLPSRVLADDIQAELSWFTHTHRQVTRIDQYVLRHSQIPAVNVEVGFLSHAREARRLKSRRYQREVAWCIFIGLMRWFQGAHQPVDFLPPSGPADLLER